MTAGSQLQRTTDIRDLGVQVSGDFKPSIQCLAAVSKANKAMYLLKRTVRAREPEVLVPLYKAFVRPHLEYCVQAWSPYLIKDKLKIEGVQRRFTKLFGCLRELDYPSRLKQLQLFSLEHRRRRADLIEVFRILNGLSQIGTDLFFLNTNTALR